MKRIIALCTAALTFTPFTFATSDLANQIKQCANTKDSLSRLICYDKIGKGLVNKKQVAVLSSDEQASDAVVAVSTGTTLVKATTQEDTFGKEHIEKTAEEKRNELTELSSTIASIEFDNRNKVTLTFTNGQKWKQIDSTTLRLGKGSKVVLKKGTFGTVHLRKAGSNKAMKVKRIK